MEDGTFYTIPTGYILIPSKYKSRDDEGNLIIHKDFFGEDCPFTLTEEGMTIPKGHYQLKDKVIQPQSSMVIILRPEHQGNGPAAEVSAESSGTIGNDITWFCHQTHGCLRSGTATTVDMVKIMW